MLKGAVMPKVAHHFQQLFQQGTGLRVEQVVGLAALDEAIGNDLQ